MTKSPNTFCRKEFFLIVLSAFFFSSTLYSNNTKEIANSKANFILEVAYNIYYTDPVESKKFIIGIYGRDVEAKAIYARLKHVTKDLKIDKKPIDVQLYKYMRTVEPVDVIFVSGEAKIRLGDLHDKLSAKSYSLITENYPFGSSAINISLDKNDQLIYELQAPMLRKNGATLRRKILENRNRIASASQWESLKTGGDTSGNYRKRENNEIEADTIAEDTLAPEIVTVYETVECDCGMEIETAVSKANSKIKWISILSLLIIGGLGYYIYKLKSSKTE